METYLFYLSSIHLSLSLYLSFLCCKTRCIYYSLLCMCGCSGWGHTAKFSHLVSFEQNNFDKKCIQFKGFFYLLILKGCTSPNYDYWYLLFLILTKKLQLCFKILLWKKQNNYNKTISKNLKTYLLFFLIITKKLC